MIDLEKKIKALEIGYEKILNELSIQKQYSDYLANQLERLFDKLKEKLDV